MLDRAMEAYKRYTEEHRWLGLRPQMAMSVCLLALAVGLAVWRQSPSSLLCAGGMLMSLIGDLLLSPDCPLSKGDKGDPLWYGGSFFAVAHLCYAPAFLLKATADRAFSLYALLAGAPALLLGWRLYLAHHKRNDHPNPALLIGAMIYWTLLCLVVTAVCGALIARVSVGGVLAAVGILSFGISDTILLCGAVGPRPIPYYDQWIWVFYPIGQLLLILGA